MASRLERLKKLLAVQEQLKALHEVRHAGFVAGAAAAKQEAADLVDRFNANDSLSALFPDIYHRSIGSARAREEANRILAKDEATKLATATARTNMVERSYREMRLARARWGMSCPPLHAPRPRWPHEHRSSRPMSAAAEHRGSRARSTGSAVRSCECCRACELRRRDSLDHRSRENARWWSRR